jgi:hypothetical protein
MADEPLNDDPELSRMLRERLPRHRAPAALHAAVREAIAPAPARRWDWLWFAPSVVGVAAALLLVLGVATRLPTGLPGDPLQQFVTAVVTEHARMLTWGEQDQDLFPVALPRAMQESGVFAYRIFQGDDELALMGAQPTFVEQRRAMSIGYMGRDGHAVTYVVMPAGSVALPDRGRVQIDRWRPVVRRESGFSVILWRERGLLCALVADLVSEEDLARLKQYFVKVRSTTELATVY